MIREVAEGDGSFGFIGTDYTDNWRLGPRPRCDLTKQVAMLAFERLLTLEPKMQLFIPKTETFDPKNRLDVVTSYPNSLIKFMLEQSLPLGEVKVVGGKVEGYVGLDDINAGFDIVESGGTLRTNGLWVPNELKDTGIEIVLLGIWRKLNQKV